jgi:hypothetical protein
LKLKAVIRDPSIFLGGVLRQSRPIHENEKFGSAFIVTVTVRICPVVACVAVSEWPDFEQNGIENDTSNQNFDLVG